MCKVKVSGYATHMLLYHLTTLLRAVFRYF